MKERSLIERVVAILGVLAGTVVWVVRLLFSLVMGVVKGKSRADEDRSGAGSSTAETGGKREALVHDIREKGQSLLEEARERGEALIGDARERVDEVRQQGEQKGTEAEGGDSHFTAAGSTSTDHSDVSSTQHDDLGGVTQMGDVAAASLSSMDTVYDEQSAAGMDDEDDGEPEGIPRLAEPGESDDTDMYGSESGSLMGENRATGYAGQPMSESDIGVDREDSISGLADSGERPGDDIPSWVSDEVDLEREDSGGADIGFGGEDDVPAASRGWDVPEDDVLKDDPLYGDFETSGTGGEVDLRNDEADEEDAAGMRIVDSPDEPFIEDEAATESLGLVTMGTEPPFDTGTDDEIDVDEIGEGQTTVSENSLAADATGRPVGDDAASGDLGPEESPDDARWAPGESRPTGDVLGAYEGSGVDEFADDAVADDMLADVTDEQEPSAGESDSGEGDDSGSESVAWATSTGVIDRDLAKPLSSDELQSGSDENGEGGPERDGEPGRSEEDAGLKDVASNVAGELDRETGSEEIATGETMSGAGQSAGAMTSDDAANDERGENEMTAATGSFARGGTSSPSDGDAAEEGAGDENADTSMGIRGVPSFNDVLPETEYQESVGYDALDADRGETTGPPYDGDSPVIVTTSASGPTGVTEVPPRRRNEGPRREAPRGSVRGDGGRDCPADFPIKGNANSKIYHRPSDSSYANTVPEFCFATEADAKAAGFRPRR